MDDLVRTAELMRERASAAASALWPGVPWKVTECTAPDLGDPSGDECPCIVYQGEYAPLTEAQSPPIQYVADAESPEHAAYIASMHPHVGHAVADLLDVINEILSGRAMPDAALEVTARDVTRAYLADSPAAAPPGSPAGAISP